MINLILKFIKNKIIIPLLNDPQIRNSIQHKIIIPFLDDPQTRDSIQHKIIIPLLLHQQIRDNIWHITNTQPSDDLNLVYLAGNIQKKLYEIATEKSAALIFNKYPMATPFLDSKSLLEHCIKKSLEINKKGLYAEFGVFSGRTINIIANLIKKYDLKIHGFDSFEGLPEDWNSTAKKSLFNMNGLLPKIEGNVVLHKGWFIDTIPEFMNDNKETVSFLHIDSDLYSSARTILNNFKDRIQAGTIILFDEFFNYPTFEDHEKKAFDEFLADTGSSCQCLGYDSNGFSVAFIVEEANRII